MDCRKARYCLVASFDEPLSEADKKDLSYHLKDCRECRHESFYYRELFSAERQLPAHQPAADFNERLLSEIRLREARSAWPKTQRRRWAFRWPLIYVPALFGAVAALSFLAFLPDQPAGPMDQAPLSQAGEAVSPPDNFVPPATGLAQEASRPRYLLTSRTQTPRGSAVIYEWPLTYDLAAGTGDPFSSQLVSQSAYQQYVRMRSREHYVFPLAPPTAERDRIY